MNMTAPGRTAKTLRLAIFLACLATLALKPHTLLAAESSGQQLYMMHCAGCHGADGNSAMPEAKNFSRYEMLSRSDQDLIDIISSGRNMMPAYLNILSDQEILDLINYVRTLN